MLTLAFFQQKLVFSVILGNTTKIGFRCILRNSFDFYWVFVGCFDQNDWTFDDIDQIGFSGPPWIIGILKNVTMQ